MLESFWMKEALAREGTTSAPLDGDIAVDVCIVGGVYGTLECYRAQEDLPRHRHCLN